MIMKTRIEQLTNLELCTYNSYNKILELCHEPLTNDQMRSKGLRYIRNTITYKWKHLIEKGYLQKINERNARGKYSTYKTIISHYPLQEYFDFINAKHYNQVNIQHKIVQRRVEEQEQRPAGHAARMAEIEAKQHETARLDRLNRKAPKVYAGHWGYQNA